MEIFRIFQSYNKTYEMKDFFDRDFWKQALATVAGGIVLFFVMRLVRGK